ncbi:MAG: hypothetical protein H6966_00600 [Chromatiaceae bacterium]|nr:hypothetical protein [Chromatiaceae bacterium]
MGAKELTQTSINNISLNMVDQCTVLGESVRALSAFAETITHPHISPDLEGFSYLLSIMAEKMQQQIDEMHSMVESLSPGRQSKNMEN